MNLERKRSDFKGLHFCTNTGVVNFGQATTEAQPLRNVQIPVSIHLALWLLSMGLWYPAKGNRACYFGCLRGVSKSVMVLTLIILKQRAQGKAIVV